MSACSRRESVSPGAELAEGVVMPEFSKSNWLLGAAIAAVVVGYILLSSES